MTPDPVRIHPQAILPQARRIMEANGIRRLPVMDGETLVGIVTYGDIREAMPSDVQSLSAFEVTDLVNLVTVDTVMNTEPVTISSQEGIVEAARLMQRHKIGGLPVVDGGELVGIITETDLCRLLVS